jgi:hypothetical protein
VSTSTSSRSPPVAPLSYASYAEIMNKLADQLQERMRTLG